MATVLFAWELGRGTGHVAPYSDYITALRRRGHRVMFAARDVAVVHQTLAHTGVEILQAPFAPPASAFAGPLSSYAGILLNCGFADVAALTARALAWRHIHSYCNPDLVVYDHSPTALAAFRGLPGAGVVSGVGFVVPPTASPLPDLSLPAPRRDGGDAENQVFTNVQATLAALGAERARRLSDLWDLDGQFLLTFEEFDPYPRAPGVLHLGAYPPPVKADFPGWPEGEGARIFGYLHASPRLPDVLGYLRGMPARILLVCRDFAGAFRFQSPKMRILERPVPRAALAGNCEATITNGTHGTTVGALLAGIPVVVLPDNLERRLVGHSAERLGAGKVIADSDPKAVKAALNRLLGDAGYTEAARAFAARYQGGDAAQAARSMLERTLPILEN